MVSKALQEAGGELGFTYVPEKGYLYGVYGGYLVTLTDAGNSKTVFLNYYLSLEDEDAESVALLELSEALKCATDTLSVTDCDVQKDGLLCTVRCDMEAFFALLDRLIGLLKEKQLAGVTHCSRCGNRIGKRYPKKFTVGNKNYLYCEHCALDALEESAKAIPEESALPKKAGLGVLGAVCGGLVGILLYLLFYRLLAPLFTDSALEIRYVLCALGFATAALTYLGFRLLCKRPCKAAYVSVPIVSLLATAVGQYFGCFLSYAHIQGFSLSQAVKLPSMWLIHFRSTMDTSLSYEESQLALYNISPLFYKLLGFSLLFALIGGIIFLMGLHEKSVAKAQPAEVESLRISLPKPQEDAADS